MCEIKNDCKRLLLNIKKCEQAMTIDGYTDAGVIGYFLKMPFKKSHTKRLLQIESDIKKIKTYINENNLDIDIDTFEEYSNSSIIYNSNQLYTLSYKQYEHRMDYLNSLKEKILILIEKI